ncbi:gustatory receptor 113 [Tribolium castaneum]|uniref:Gustatory receptor n=1 Tax=Tribolium castaneum TaxID=7070 RepID=D6WRQ0_TRICA|nr:PREDICTED: uncharacterized protein LOC107398215 [Tribolium castaneum]EFA07610.1 gustatory receptor 113 [Tribolium castaneum]|eukprot:XP_015837068.1 PREDICTED: uncharacterized protein LOC107398215 [Tribolium castaneum]
MRFNLSLKDINFIRPLWSCYNILLITPWYDFDQNAPYRPKISKLYGSLIILLKIISIAAMTVNSSLEQTYEYLFVTQQLNYALCSVDMWALTFFGIVKSSFGSVDNWRKLFSRLQFIDLKLQNTGKTEKQFWKNIYFAWFLKQVIFFGASCGQMYIWSVLMKASYFKTIWTTPLLDYLFAFELIILINVLTESIKVRYKDLNKRLLKISGSPKVTEELKHLVFYHRILGEVVELINKIFGYQIILIVFLCGLQLVGSLNFPFTAFTTLELPLRPYLLLSLFILTIGLLGSLLQMVISMDSTVEEAKTFVDRCYKMQEQFTLNFRNSDELIKFISIAKHNVRTFSAGGFFDIRKNLIFSLIANVAMYFVISVQFNQNQKE